MNTYYLRQNTHLGKDSIRILKSSKVVIVGLGGLGSGVAQILSRMGVGNIVLIDKDDVQDHNLSRQQLYTTDDIGRSKVDAARSHINEINPEIDVDVIKDFATVEILEGINDVSCVVDCTDRHSSRRVIDSFCLKNGLPWVHGAAIREQGVVCVFGSDHGLESYEDIYAGKDVDEFCEGVIATTTNLISSLQASLVIKLLLKRPVPKGLLRVNLDEWTFVDLDINK